MDSRRRHSVIHDVASLSAYKALSRRRPSAVEALAFNLGMLPEADSSSSSSDEIETEYALFLLPACTFPTGERKAIYRALHAIARDTRTPAGEPKVYVYVRATSKTARKHRRGIERGHGRQNVLETFDACEYPRRDLASRGAVSCWAGIALTAAMTGVPEKWKTDLGVFLIAPSRFVDPDAVALIGAELTNHFSTINSVEDLEDLIPDP